MDEPDLRTLLVKRGMGIAELERRAGTGRESLRRLLDRRDPRRVSVGVALRLARAAGVPVERLVRAIEQTRAFHAERAERRRRVEEAIETARRG
jgi:lambda repressor-like predicted transcriptional regulator